MLLCALKAKSSCSIISTPWRVFLGRLDCYALQCTMLSLFLWLQVCVGVVRQIHLRDTRRMFCPGGHWLSSRVTLPLNNCQTVSFIPRTNRRQRRLFMPQRLLTRNELGNKFQMEPQASKKCIKGHPLNIHLFVCAQVY